MKAVEGGEESSANAKGRERESARGGAVSDGNTGCVWRRAGGGEQGSPTT